jgi:hypothetical protein
MNQVPTPAEERPTPHCGEGNDLTLAQVVGSVFAAGFGVQSKENKVRDFSRGKPLQFIAAGLFFTLALLAGLVALVNLVV